VVVEAVGAVGPEQVIDKISLILAYTSEFDVSSNSDRVRRAVGPTVGSMSEECSDGQGPLSTVAPNAKSAMTRVDLEERF
jgi:hypothetical protein